MAVAEHELDLIETVAPPSHFAWREDEEQDLRWLETPGHVPADAGYWWVGGTSVLADGHPVPSVFLLNTGVPGERYRTWWRIDGEWFRHDDPAVADHLGPAAVGAEPVRWWTTLPPAAGTAAA